MVFAVIRLKGNVNLNKDIELALRSLRLNRKNHCAILGANKDALGIVVKVQPYVTWGELDAQTLANMLSKRGRLAGNRRLTSEYLREKTGKTIQDFSRDIVETRARLKDVPGLKPIFRLKPPTKGLESKGMKRPYSLGGSYGYRGKDINELLMRMI
jgi:large subunit ribosomal protein L30